MRIAFPLLVASVCSSASALAESRRARATEQQDPEAILSKARAAYDGLDYERVMPLADQVIALAPVGAAGRCVAYSLKASALASMGNAPDAETVFSSLIDECPSYEMPADTSPRILVPFHKVRDRARATASEREAERRRRVAAMTLVGEHPRTTVAGKPLLFDYQLRDPSRDVRGFDVRYRPAGQGDFEALRLEPLGSERWSAAISGEWTATRGGGKVEFYLATLDGSGAPLLTVGEPGAPLVATIEAQEVEAAMPVYRKAWFWVAATGVVALGVTSAILIARAGDVPDSDLGSVPFP